MIPFYALTAAFAVIACGFLLREIGLITGTMWEGLERACYYVFFPALIIKALGTTDLSSAPVGSLAATLAFAQLAMMVLMLLARPFIIRWFSLSGPQYSSVFQGATRWHTFIGLAMIAAAFGDEGVVLASIAVATMVPISNVVNVVVVAANSGDGLPPVRRLVLLVAKNPFIVSCAIGLALNVSGIPLWSPIVLTLDIAGRAATGVGLIVVGAGLYFREIAGSRWAVGLSTAMKLIVMPLLGAVGCLIFDVEGLARTIVFIATGVPTATASYILARQLGGDAEMMAGILSAQIIAAIVTLPVILWMAVP